MRTGLVAGGALVLVAGFAGAQVGSARRDDAGEASRGERVALVERMMWDRYGAGPRVALASTSEPAAISDMIAHHSDAVDGSLALLADPDLDPAVRDFAKRIVRVQTEQIATMRTFLDEWYPGIHEPSRWMAMFADPRTTANESAFLATMIEHHEHAITMYAGWVAAGLVTHDDLGLLAARIAKGQEGEIATMRQLATIVAQPAGAS